MLPPRTVTSATSHRVEPSPKAAVSRDTGSHKHLQILRPAPPRKPWTEPEARESKTVESTTSRVEIGTIEVRLPQPQAPIDPKPSSSRSKQRSPRFAYPFGIRQG